MGGGRVLESLDYIGGGNCGAYRTHFLSPGEKTWYLNYALYGLFDASLASLGFGGSGTMTPNQGQISMESVVYVCGMRM